MKKLTTGERAIWSSVYAGERRLGKSIPDSLRWTAQEIYRLREADANWKAQSAADDDAGQMLAQMLQGDP